MTKQAIRTSFSAVFFFLNSLFVSPAAFAQAFLEPVSAGDSSFLSSTVSSAAVNANTAATAATSTSSFVPNYSKYEAALNRFDHEATQLPSGAELQDISFGTSSTLLGCPFTDATRGEIETIASNWINASLAAGAGHNSSRILTRDKQLSSLANRDQQLLGSNYAVLSAQNRLIQSQDLALVNMNGGQDITTSQMKLLNREENNLSNEIKDLAGN